MKSPAHVTGLFFVGKFGPIIILVYIMNLELMNLKKYFILPDQFLFQRPSESSGYIEIKKIFFKPLSVTKP